MSALVAGVPVRRGAVAVVAVHMAGPRLGKLAFRWAVRCRAADKSEVRAAAVVVWRSRGSVTG